MNEGLIDAFRHNARATQQVLEACQGLSGAELDTAVTGTFGSVIATLRHIVAGEASYCARLTGLELSWDRRADDEPDLATLSARVDELAQRWERFLATPFDAERTFDVPWDDGAIRVVPAGVVLVQVLHHGCEHRAQIMTTLTSLGVPARELGLWRWAAATGRANVRR